MTLNPSESFTVATLDDFIKGWIVGAFEPTLLHTTDVEVGIKKYQKGDQEDAHHHKIATEISVILSGRVKMLGREFSEGDIIRIAPGTSTAFEALTDAVTVVIKHPGAPNDKYPN